MRNHRAIMKTAVSPNMNGSHSQWVRELRLTAPTRRRCPRLGKRASRTLEGVDEHCRAVQPLLWLPKEQTTGPWTELT